MREAGIAAENDEVSSATRRTRTTRTRWPRTSSTGTFDPAEPNASWVADVTYIPTREGWLYLAVVVDLFSRRTRGRLVDGRDDDEPSRGGCVGDGGVSSAQRVVAGLIAHSDRGSQYASEHYRRRLTEERITCSMSRRGNCWDNAPMESFFASLKKELVHDEDYGTRDQATASIFEYIEVFDNRVRRHSSLGYVAPAEFERTHNPTHR